MESTLFNLYPNLILTWSYFPAQVLRKIPHNYVKKILHTKQVSPINLNNYLSTASNFFTFINKKTALEKLAINAQALLTIFFPDPTTLILDNLKRTCNLYAKWLSKDTEKVIERFKLATDQQGRCKDINKNFLGLFSIMHRLRQYKLLSTNGEIYYFLQR